VKVRYPAADAAHRPNGATRWLPQATLALLCAALALASMRCGAGRLPGLAADKANVATPGERWRAPRRLVRKRVLLLPEGTRRWHRGAEPVLREALRRRATDARLGADLSLLPLSGQRGSVPAQLYLELRRALELAADVPPQPPAAPALLVRARPPGRHASRETSGARLLVIGARLPVPFDAPAEQQTDALAAAGGSAVALGPPGDVRALLEQAPELARTLDGLGVYGPWQRDDAAAAAGEAAYRWATAYSGGSLRLAAVGASGRGEPAGGHTDVFADGANVTGIAVALRARRTVASRGRGDLRVELEGLGRIVRSSEVDLRLELSHPVVAVELWREQQKVRVYRGVRGVEFRERISANTAYTFRIVDRGGTALTSAVWYEPLPAGLPDLEVEPSSLGWEGGRAQAVVRNRGNVTARFVELRFSEGRSGWARAGLLGRTELHTVAPGRAIPVELPLEVMPEVLSTRLASAIPGRVLVDAQPRDNRAWRPLHGPALLQWEQALDIDHARSLRLAE